MNADIGQMQEMTVYQSCHSPKMLRSLPAGVGLVMASGKNTYTLVHACAFYFVISFSSNLYCAQFLIFCSVGSLGKSEIAMVEQITVSNCSFVGTFTGVRIKSWQVMKINLNAFVTRLDCIHIMLYVNHRPHQQHTI
jgi:hypothetical protein